MSRFTPTCGFCNDPAIGRGNLPGDQSRIRVCAAHQKRVENFQEDPRTAKTLDTPRKEEQAE